MGIGKTGMTPEKVGRGGAHGADLDQGLPRMPSFLLDCREEEMGASEKEEAILLIAGIDLPARIDKPLNRCLKLDSPFLFIAAEVESPEESI